MKTYILNFCLAGALLVGCLTLGSIDAALGQESSPSKEFSKPVIDIGIVARNIDASARFYTNALGCTEVPGFAVTADLGRKIGLIDNHPVKVRMFVLGEGDLRTHIKLMSFPDAPGKP